MFPRDDMPAIPSFVLKNLYVAASLRSAPEGCQLQIKNTLASATITGVGPILFDGVRCDPQQIALLRGGERLQASEATPARPFAFGINSTITIIFSGVALAPGRHRIGLSVMTREAGRLAWDIEDDVRPTAEGA
jgi:hypothetical protein